MIKFDAKQLQYSIVGDDRDATVAADRVLWIEPAELPEGQRAMIASFDEGEFGQSLSMLPDVLKARPAIWRQQWLTMMAACAARRSGRPKIALDLLAQLDRRSLPPMVLAWIPINWNGGAQPRSNQDQAIERIADPSPLVQLVAASWLLNSAKRSPAIAQLKILTQAADRPHIARLAQVLLWTTQPPSVVIESEGEWLAKLESLPMVLQTGPSMALQRKLRSSGQIESANRLLWSNQLTPVNRFPLQ